MINVPVHLRTVPPPVETFNHAGFIEFIFSYMKPERYLELGVRSGTSFIPCSKYCKLAIGVDMIPPQFPLQSNMSYFQTTTDQYFENLHKDEVFDAVFIDADHSHEQSLKDFMNVKDRVIEDGIIFFHDTYPYNKEMMSPGLCNDVYKTVLHIKQNFIDDFEVMTLPFNPGVTIAKKMKRNKQLAFL